MMFLKRPIVLPHCFDYLHVPALDPLPPKQPRRLQQLAQPPGGTCSAGVHVTTGFEIGAGVGGSVGELFGEVVGNFVGNGVGELVGLVVGLGAGESVGKLVG
mmetsp:Transcript_32190/g.54945  ORF Transcript_32190/g.54945 Transcript_32190/m.54945 type:complete len:102 (+) Transcript_32190:157-462(+)